MKYLYEAKITKQQETQSAAHNSPVRLFKEPHTSHSAAVIKTARALLFFFTC